jgi:hypothetical protein
MGPWNSAKNNPALRYVGVSIDFTFEIFTFIVFIVAATENPHHDKEQAFKITVIAGCVISQVILTALNTTSTIKTWRTNLSHYYKQAKKYIGEK